MIKLISMLIIFIYIFKCSEEVVRQAASWSLPLLRQSTIWSSRKTKREWQSSRMFWRRGESKYREINLKKVQASTKQFNSLKSSSRWLIIKFPLISFVRSLKLMPNWAYPLKRLKGDCFKMVQTNWHKRKALLGQLNC